MTHSQSSATLVSGLAASQTSCQAMQLQHLMLRSTCVSVKQVGRKSKGSCLDPALILPYATAVNWNDPLNGDD